jgi:4'-phosphopantetheinyl transferase
MALSPVAVHVVDIQLDHVAEDDEGLLDDSERMRARRFLNATDRTRFVAAHAALRTVLGRILDRSADRVTFAFNAHGKPTLADAGSQVHFNLSHSCDRALIAVAFDRPVGVDIEKHRRIDEAALARRFLSAPEREQIEGATPADRSHAFFSAWTRKEALAKAIGGALFDPLDEAATERWRVERLAVDSGYSAAVASLAGGWRVIRWNGISTSDGVPHDKHDA